MIGISINQYRITAGIGAGGMGEVFRARDTRLNRDVAVKVLPKGFVSDADRRRRFEQEAQMLASLNHPNILTVHDAGVHEGTPYLVSELLEGQTLRDLLGSTANGALPVRKATDYALQIAHGLAAAHDRGVIHRDLKPENIFVTKDERVKILDFGLAKLRANSKSAIPNPESSVEADAPTLVESTEPGLVLGTPAYMSPEQVRGEPTDHRSDIFSFGCVLYEMISGARAFRRDTPVESMNAVLHDAPPELGTTHPSIPDVLKRIVERCLDKQPERRFQNASDLAFAIESAREKSLIEGKRGVSFARRWPRVVFGLAAVVLFATGIGWWLLHTPGKATRRVAQLSTHSALPNNSNTAPSAEQKSIAVLAFENMSADKDNEYFSDGIAEEILNALARIPGLRVAARTSSFSFKGKNETVPHIGEALHVRYLLEGSVRRAGDKLRITAQLVNAAEGFRVWSEEFDRKAEDVFAIQTEVAQRVLEALKMKLLDGTNSNITLTGTDNLEAYDLYLRGRELWNKRTGTDAQRATGLFQQAAEKDPKFAAAYAGLACSYVLLPEYASVPVREANPKARAAALRALELDRRLAEAHAVLGECATFDWDLVGAEREFQEALRLNPNHATSHHWYSIMLADAGRWDEAIAQGRKAQTVDPLAAIIQSNLAERLAMSGRRNEALVETEKALKLSSDFPPAHLTRGKVFLLERKLPEAIAEFEKIRNKTGDTPYALGWLGYAFSVAGRTNEARQVLDQLKSASDAGRAAAFEMGFVHLGLREMDQAFVWLERTAESHDRDPRAWKTDPFMGDVVKDRRYAALLKKFGLDK